MITTIMRSCRNGRQRPLLIILLFLVIVYAVLELPKTSLTYKFGSYSQIWTSPHVDIFPIVDLKDHNYRENKLPNPYGREIKIYYDTNGESSGGKDIGRLWESSAYTSLQNYMRRDANLQFIDIGTGDGAYALYVAMLGRTVIATDASTINLRILAQSVKANGLSNHITLVNNAIEANRTTLSLAVKKGGSVTQVKAISAEHLLKIITFKRAVLKVNIQGNISIVRTFSKCVKLFQQVDIPLVILKKPSNVTENKYIYNFMKKRGYTAFPAIDSESPLRCNYTYMPLNVVWKRDTVANPIKISDLRRIPDSRIMKFESPVVSEIFNQFTYDTPAGKLIINGHESFDLITGSVMRKRWWENHLMSAIAGLLKQDKTQGFIDIGSNIGIYTIFVAKLGHKTVAVDGNIGNIVRVRKSLIQNGVKDQVSLINNAVYNKYTTVGMVVPQEHVGLGTVVDDTDKRYKQRNVRGIDTITLDDLLKVTTFKKAILKIDIEGKEYHAFCNSSKLLKEIDVTHVFMEWGYYSKYVEKKREGEFMLKHFGELGYVPLANAHAKTILAPNFRQWPWDVVWVKKYVFDKTMKPKTTPSSQTVTSGSFTTTKRPHTTTKRQ